jgi:hypothetical protein
MVSTVLSYSCDVIIYFPLHLLLYLLFTITLLICDYVVDTFMCKYGNDD